MGCGKTACITVSKNTNANLTKNVPLDFDLVACNISFHIKNGHMYREYLGLKVNQMEMFTTCKIFIALNNACI